MVYWGYLIMFRTTFQLLPQDVWQYRPLRLHNLRAATVKGLTSSQEGRDISSNDCTFPPN